MKIQTKLTTGIALAATALVVLAVPCKAIDLLERYPTTLTAGDAVPEHARPWEFNNGDVFRLSQFNLGVGKGLRIEMGPADAGIAHCADGAVWAVLIPREGGKLTRSATDQTESIAHVWLRFHPKEISRVFPAETVFTNGATDAMPQMRDIAASKFRSSWHAGMNAMIPEPKDMTVDVDTKAGLRRFFMVDTAAQKAEYVAAFEQQSLHPSPSEGETRISLDSAPSVVVKTFPVAGSTEVDPALTEVRVTYSKAMQDGSWSWSTWGGENYPETTGQPKYLSDNRTCVLPVKLQPRKFYAIWLNSDKFKNFKDTSGRPAVPYLLTFRTGERRSAAVSGPLIERAVVSAKEARIEGRGAADGRIIFRVGRDNYWSCGFVGDARFTAVLDRDGKKLRCVVRDSEGHSLLTSTMSEQGSVKFTEGRIVFLEGTRTPKSDGTINVAEFRPNSGASLPITAQVGKQVEQLLRQQRDSETSPPASTESGIDAKIAQLAKAGTTVDDVLRLLGEPEQYLWGRQVFKKDNLPDRYILKYPGGVQVVVSGRNVVELRSEQPGPGFTYRGKLRLGSSLDEVLAIVDVPSETIVGEPLKFAPDVLYKDIDGQKGYCYYARPDQQIRCFFMDYKITALYLPLGQEGDSPQANANTELIEREVNKLVSELASGSSPWQPDLSTPETACAAWLRAYSNKDRNGVETINRLSWVQIDPGAEAEWFRRERARDPEGLAIFLKALAEAKMIAVQTWRGELANVITFLPFPEGKGRSPYSARVFGLRAGQWKNLGEDRLPDLESARANFDQKKERLWQQFAQLTAKTSGGPTGTASDAFASLLNDDQRLVLAWTERQFRAFFDARTFDGCSEKERADLEARLIDSLNGPITRDYYQAINTLAALRSTKALPKLRAIAFDRADKDNRDRWMSIRAIGIIGDKSAVPELVHLVYHGNVNTRWWAQMSLVRLTGNNFGKDWTRWGNWWNEQNGQPPFKPEIIRWWSGQAEADRLAESLNESDQKFLEGLKPKAANMSSVSQEQAKRIRDAAPLMDTIRQQWRAANDALNQRDTTNALAVLQTLVPKIEESRDVFQGTPMESGVRKTLELMDPLKRALQQGDFPTVKQLMLSIGELGRGIEGQLKLVETAGQSERDQPQTGENYLKQQLKLANAGNYWAKFNLWQAFSQGRHEVAKTPAEADKWLSELVKEAYLARFEPVNGFTPKTPKEMLDKFNEYCQLRSGRDSLGGASFFRTTKQDDKLIGSFLTATPEEFKTAIQTHPSLKLISIEKVTPEMFLAHEAAKQESL